MVVSGHATTIASFQRRLWYHVLNRAVGRLRIFGNTRLRGLRRGDRGGQSPSADASVGVVRPVEHCISCFAARRWRLSEFMRWLGDAHATLHAAHRTAGTGPLYQGRFKSFPIQEDDHL